MTYVTEQTSQELRAHMRRLKAMAGWHEPLADRLYKEILELDAELAASRLPAPVAPAGSDAQRHADYVAGYHFGFERGLAQPAAPVVQATPTVQPAETWADYRNGDKTAPTAQPAEPIGFISHEHLANLQNPEWRKLRDAHANLWGINNPPSRALVPVYLGAAAAVPAVPVASDLEARPNPVGWYSKLYGFVYMHLQPHQFQVGSTLYLKDGTPAWRIESTCSKTALLSTGDLPHGTVFYDAPAQVADAPATPTVQPAVTDAPKYWCETCEGAGTIDETLGGEYFSNPKAECPDCDGNGYWTPAASRLPAPVAIPEGWKLVPIEPTQEMLTAGVKEQHGNAVYKSVAASGCSTYEGEQYANYTAMIAAAPQPAAPAQAGFHVCRRHDFADIITNPKEGCPKCNAEKAADVKGGAA